LAGIVLTGSNADGSAGLRAVEDAGGLAFIQAPQTAAFAEMPRAALKACARAQAASLPELSKLLSEGVLAQ
jgi:two-component system, chemotaxis family, protein-glutamate methylesterase/glutaminase